MAANRLGIILEKDGVGEADDVGHEEIGDNHGHVEVNLDGTEVAVGTAVGGGVCTGRDREGALSAAACADGLIDSPMLVESACTTVHVLACAARRASKVGGINDVGGVVADRHEVEVAAVSGGLEGVAGDGQTVGAAKTVELLRPPTREIDVVAVIDQQRGGREVGSPVPAAEGCGPYYVREVFRQFRQKLSAAGHKVGGILHPLHPIGEGLSQNVRKIFFITLDKVGLVVVVLA